MLKSKISRHQSLVCTSDHVVNLHSQQLTTSQGPTDVLIKLNATGICHSDIHFMLNDWAAPKMSAMGTQCAGHEGAGVIVKVGDQVKTLKTGMRAGLKVRVFVATSGTHEITDDSLFKIRVAHASSVVAVENATVQVQCLPD